MMRCALAARRTACGVSSIYLAVGESRPACIGPADLGDEDRLRADELCLELRFAVLQEHGDHFAQVGVQLVQAVPWLWAPGNPGTYPTKTPVSGSRSMTAV